MRLMSSDGHAIIPAEVGRNDLCSNPQLPDVRPQTANAGGLAVSGGRMSSLFGGTGRPSAKESDRRRCEFLRLVSEGVDFDQAAVLARISDRRALRILSHPDVRPLLTKAA